MNLNEYFSRPEKFKNKIIVMSVRDEASRYISRFTAGLDLGLALKLKFRESYVALIDFSRDFVYEKSSGAQIRCSYKVGKRYIDIVSAGFECGNFSSVKVGRREYSMNSNGLNVVILKSKSLLPVDSFVCNSYLDRELKIVTL